MRLPTMLILFAAVGSSRLSAQKPFTLEQILSAPYASDLTAAPVGDVFAWVEDSEGRHSLWVGGGSIDGKAVPARALTHYTEDDGQDITQLAWAPDARAIAYTYGAPNGADGKPANPAHLQRPTPVQVIVQPLAGDAKPVVIGEGHSPMFDRYGHRLFFVRGGQIWSADLDATCASATGCEIAVRTKSVHQMVFDRGSASQLVQSPDGNILAFISRRREEGEPSHSFLALYDLQGHTLSFPAPSSGNDSAPAFSPDGNSLAWLRAPFTQAPEFANPRSSANPWSIQLLELAGRKTRTAFSPEANKPGSVLPHMATGEPGLMFAKNDAIVFASEADGWLHLYLLKVSTGKVTGPLTPGEFEVEDPVLSPDRSRIYFSANGPRKLPATVPSPVTGKRVLTDLPWYTERRNLFAIDMTQAVPVAEQLEICCNIDKHPQVAADGTVADLVSDAWKPMHPQIVDATHGSWEKGRSHTPLHPNDDLDLRMQDWYPAQPDLALIDSTEGLHLHGQLFMPRTSALSAAPAGSWGDTKHPAILFVHGGPNRQMLLGYPSMEYYSNAYAMNQYLASRGFIVLSLNYRCGIGYGLEFRQCLHAGAEGAEEYNDVLAAAKYLRGRADVDATRIGIWGGSYGGYLTALALARNSDWFAAGVDFHGVHDWNLEDNAGDWRIGSNAEKDAIAAKALASSPLGDLSKWTSPVLLIHGDDDPDVAYAQTPTLADALRARKVPVQELIFPDEVHEFLLHKDWLAAYTAAAAFFEQTLADKK